MGEGQQLVGFIGEVDLPALTWNKTENRKTHNVCKQTLFVNISEFPHGYSFRTLKKVHPQSERPQGYEAWRGVIPRNKLAPSRAPCAVRLVSDFG